MLIEQLYNKRILTSIIKINNKKSPKPYTLGILILLVTLCSNQPLTAPSVTPLMINLDKKRYTITTGIIASKIIM